MLLVSRRGGERGDEERRLRKFWEVGREEGAAVKGQCARVFVERRRHRSGAHWKRDGRGPGGGSSSELRVNNATTD